MPTHLDRAALQAAEVPGLQSQGVELETHRGRVALLHDAEAEDENQVRPSHRIHYLLSSLAWLLLGAQAPQ